MLANARNTSENVSSAYGFDIKTGKHLCHIIGVILRDQASLALFSLVGLLSLLEEYVIYNVGNLPSGFYDVLGNKNWKRFLHHSLFAILLIFAITFILSSKQYVINVFYIFSRKVLTLHLQTLYFANNHFYHINATSDSKITDNPDQRLTQDIDKFSSQLSSIASPCLVSPFTICYYTYICYVTMGWTGPVSIFLIFLVSAVINRLLISPVMSKVITQEKCEGFFRFKHMYVRTHAESIALQDGSYAELLRAEKRFGDLISIQHMLYLRQYPLDASINLFNYIGSILSYLVLAVPIFSGRYSGLNPTQIASLISRNAFASIYLMSCFTKINSLSTALSQLAGLTYRVSELLDYVHSVETFHGKTSEICKGQVFERPFRETDPIVFKLRNVSFGSPSRNSVLVSNLNLTITLGTNLIVTGNSSSGKTSLIRILKGLWPILHGTIERRMEFLPSHMFFLSQKPLMSDGSLLHQIVYPLEPILFAHNAQEDRDSIYSLMEYVGLEHLMEKCGGLEGGNNWDWNSVLSPGEAQRLTFVRLFYHKPKLAFLDEATSAVTLEVEERLYNKCKELNISVVSIGHRSSLLHHHNEHLHLDGLGGWVFKQLEENLLLLN